MASREQNKSTQPLQEQAIFNNAKVLTEGWYPMFPSKKLSRKKTHLFQILNQRIVVFRGEDGSVHALDAFCPHMGADLNNGHVEGNELRCYFHRWKFSGAGHLTDIPCQKSLPANVKLKSYPTAERYGFVWVFSGDVATHAVPAAPGLSGLSHEQISAVYVRKGTLYAHHHILMANGLDTQHFSAVHGLNIDFTFKVEEKFPEIFDWDLSGKIPRDSSRGKLAYFILGENLAYRVRIAGGSIAAITYGDKPRFRGNNFLLPELHILWGCVPLLSGVSEVRIFILSKKRRGMFAPFKNAFQFLITLIVLAILKDDDVKAFPNMRFNVGSLIAADASVGRLIHMINRLRLSVWN